MQNQPQSIQSIQPAAPSVIEPLQSEQRLFEQNLDAYEYNANANYIQQQQNSITNFNNRIRQLQQKQQILKYSVCDHQQSVKVLFMELYNKKKKLLDLMTKQHNTKNFNVDIGLLEQFQQMRKTIQNQQMRIQKLKQDIQRQGLTGASTTINYQDMFKLKQKRQQLQNDIEKGSKFAATQYVRDYLQRTYVHKVNYEDVKMEYETKLQLKQVLQIQKLVYQRKRDQVKRAIEREGAIKKQLEEQKAKLQYIISVKGNSNGIFK